MNTAVEELSLRTRDGVVLATDVYRTEGTPRGGVVIAHGFTASRRLPEVVDQARNLVERGFVVLTYDCRGHGASSGECTLGRFEAYDVAAAVEHLRPLVPSVITVGASMGAIAVLAHAVEDSGLAGVVLVSMATSLRSVLTLRAVVATALTRTRTGRTVARRRMGVRISPEWQAGESSLALIARLRMPVAIVHGRGDRMVRANAAVALHTAANEPRRLELVDDMGHSFQTAAVPAIVRAVEWCDVVSRSRP